MAAENSHNLVKVLSARSYLPADEQPSATRDSANSSTASTVEINTSPKQSSLLPMESTRVTRQRRSSRNAGRPRLDTQGTAVLSEVCTKQWYTENQKRKISDVTQSRRKQVRQAQKTYRLKKEAVLQNTQARVAELEQKIDGISEAFSDLYDVALGSDLKSTHPALFDHFNEMKRLLTTNTGRFPTSPSQESSSTGRREAGSARKCATSVSESVNSSCEKGTSQQNVFGYCPLPSESMEATPESVWLSPDDYHEDSQTDGNNSAWRSFGNFIYTYCFQETKFSRRLQRYCLEYAFRLFSDPRSHPNRIYRVFRLVPCIQNKAKMYPYFKRLIMAGSEESLEIQALPFYCIGGAGTHYPVLDDMGSPIYPPKMRLPKRLLGVLPVVRCASDVESNWDTDRLLEVCGFGGQWFDCRDVEGYLSARGVRLEESSLFPRVEGLLERVSQSSTANFSPSENSTTDSRGQSEQNYPADKPLSPSEPLHQYILDVESFFLREYSTSGLAVACKNSC